MGVCTMGTVARGVP